MGWQIFLGALGFAALLLGGFIFSDWSVGRAKQREREDFAAYWAEKEARTRAEREARLARLNDAWDFYFWCDAVHHANFAAPSERFRIERGANGRWFVRAYVGARPSPELERRLYSVGTMPVAIPNREHAWETIGGDYGFSFLGEALDFFREYDAAPDFLRFDENGAELP